MFRIAFTYCVKSLHVTEHYLGTAQSHQGALTVYSTLEN